MADLATYLAVVRCESVSGAARELNVTQSQVSKAVNRLEKRLRVRLFDRKVRGVVPTASGRQAARLFDETLARMKELGGGAVQPMEVTVGAPSYLSQMFLPQFTRALPELRFRGIELPPSLLRAHAATRLFDVAVANGEGRFPTTWSTTQVGVLRRGLFANSALRRRLGRGPIPEARVLEHPFIFPVFHANGQLIPGEDGCPIPIDQRKVGHEVSTMALALDMAVHTPQLVFGPWLTARRHVERGELVEIEVANWSVREPLFVSCNVDRVLSRVQKRIVEVAKQQLEES